VYAASLAYKGPSDNRPGRDSQLVSDRLSGQCARRGLPPGEGAFGLAASLGMRPLVAHCHLGLGKA